MSSLRERLEEARAEVARIEREIKATTCAEAGHDWRSIGGTNAACSSDCACSVPVFECSVCGDSDYGDNDEAAGIIEVCRRLQ